MTDTFTVRELCTALSAAVSSAFPDEVWVQGSISGLTRAANGHVYFDLVDPADEVGSATPGVLPVTLFASDRQRVNAILRKAGNIRMSDGVEIRIRGRVAYYPPQGRVQLRMSLIDPAYTVGQMAAARQALLDTLAAEGLLNVQRGLELPVPPLRIALLTSAGSAAHADFAHELAQSGYPFEITLYDCRVQGVDAVASIVEALTLAASGYQEGYATPPTATIGAPTPSAGSTGPVDDGLGWRPPPDAVVLVRGGGARTDLAAFDHERVARAIARCPLPVLVGVGHEIDRSVADEVAHLSAKTPTATAALLVEAVRAFHREVEQAAARLAGLAGARLDGAAGRLSGAGGRLVAAANGLVTSHHTHLDRHRTQLRYLAERCCERAGAHLSQAELHLRAHDPAAALARGWSITHTAAGELVRDAATVAPGTVLVTTVAAGSLTSSVTGATTGGKPGSGPDDDPSSPDAADDETP
ncbi:MAG: exodeoxyribonuclease VII large subunit [Acidimicrobiales bacterium]